MARAIFAGRIPTAFAHILHPRRLPLASQSQTMARSSAPHRATLGKRSFTGSSHFHQQPKPDDDTGFEDLGSFDFNTDVLVFFGIALSTPTFDMFDELFGRETHKKENDAKGQGKGKVGK